MSEIDKNIEHDPSKDSETAALIQGQENANSVNKDEKQEVQKDTKPKAKTDGGGRTKAVKPAKVDSKNQTKGNSTKEGDQLGSEVKKDKASDDKPEQPKVAKFDSKSAQRDKVAAEVFANNVNCTKLFFTSDEIPFFVESDAIKHAFSLDDKTIIPKYKE